MWQILVFISALAVCALISLWLIRSRGRRELERHSISPEELHCLQDSGQGVLVLDVRQPLDLLAYPQIIPGAKRIAPAEVLAKPSLIPNDQDAVVYCTCPSDKTSRKVLDRALAAGFHRIKFLRGGLAGWKAKGYPIEPYTETFNLYSATG